jgi:NhaA family Na+:H+ antiporter
MTAEPTDAERTAESASPVANTDAEVTAVIEQAVRPGREAEFEQFLQDIVEDAWQFPGFINVRVTKPVRNERMWRVVLRYDSRDHLRAWLESDIRRQYEERRAELVESDPRVRDLTGTSQARPLAQRLMPIGDFVEHSVSGIGLLLAGTAIALLMVNFGWEDQYDRLWAVPLTIGTDRFGLTESLRHWVNDGLMALFFFTVGLEIKREILVGELRSMRNAALPIAAAVGGAIVPALLYLALNHGHQGADGWGIPMATDTAFSIGVLTLMGVRVEPLLIVFLTAFAIVDDMLAVGVIAVFYTDTVHWRSVALAIALLGVLLVCNVAGFHRWPVYAFLGVCVWLAVFNSGIHGTLAGILVALTVPARSWINPSEFMMRSRALLDDFENACDRGQTLLSNQRQQRAAQELETLIEDTETPMTHLQHRLNPWVAYGVLPLFAFANAGIPFTHGLGGALGSRVTWGVMLGLLVAKPVGISLFSWLAVRIGVAQLPERVTWPHLISVGALGGIGFTMSLFVTELAFGGGSGADHARIGIAIASILAGMIGYLLLDRTLPREAAGDG